MKYKTHRSIMKECRGKDQLRNKTESDKSFVGREQCVCANRHTKHYLSNSFRPEKVAFHLFILFSVSICTDTRGQNGFVEIINLIVYDIVQPFPFEGYFSHKHIHPCRSKQHGWSRWGRKQYRGESCVGWEGPIRLSI